MEASRLTILGWVILNIDLSCIRLVTAIPKVSRLTPMACCMPTSTALRVEMKSIGSSPVLTMVGQPSLMVAIMESGPQLAKALPKKVSNNHSFTGTHPLHPLVWRFPSGKVSPNGKTVYLSVHSKPRCWFDWSSKMDSSNRRNGYYRTQSDAFEM